MSLNVDSVERVVRRLNVQAWLANQYIEVQICKRVAH